MYRTLSGLLQFRNTWGGVVGGGSVLLRTRARHHRGVHRAPRCLRGSVCVSGGDEPHIGSVVLAEARASLTGEGTSATSSVLNRLGHKDEFVARTVAETLAAALDTTACCICGIHKDNATPEDIQASTTLGHEIVSILLERLAPNSSQQ